MNFFNKNSGLVEELAQCKQQCEASENLIKAFSRSMAIIEFSPSGDILKANENFLVTMGYEQNQIVDKHHSIFCTQELVASAEYKEGWRKLASGQATEGQFKRVTNQGKEIWLAASYCPVLDNQGHVTKVVKIAADVSRTVHAMHDLKAQVNAVSRAMATIEFDTQGNILTANDNFLQTTGYTAAELEGQHHRIFWSYQYHWPLA